MVIILSYLYTTVKRGREVDGAEDRMEDRLRSNQGNMGIPERQSWENEGEAITENGWEFSRTDKG